VDRGWCWRRARAGEGKADGRLGRPFPQSAPASPSLPRRCPLQLLQPPALPRPLDEAVVDAPTALLITPFPADLLAKGLKQILTRRSVEADSVEVQNMADPPFARIVVSTAKSCDVLLSMKVSVRDDCNLKNGRDPGQGSPPHSYCASRSERKNGMASSPLLAHSYPGRHSLGLHLTAMSKLTIKYDRLNSTVLRP
jgi:hypothetical protein